jgi:tRNA (uracil-5-)-methyltransferase TRM9
MAYIDNFESLYVSETYEQISKHFSSTRYSHWTNVKDYIQQINLIQSKSKSKSKSKINFLDYGCGNGKYLSLCEQFNTTGFDNCENLLQIVRTNYPNITIVKGDVCELNTDLTNNFDSIICVAVIHHLSSITRRIESIKNIIKYLKQGGTALISVWSNNIDKTKYTKLETEGDYLIGWNNQYQRYYHLFEQDELDKLIIEADEDNEIKIIQKTLECNNWIIVIEKKVVKVN